MAAQGYEFNLRMLYLSRVSDIRVQYTRTESDRLGYATVRIRGCPIAEVFREGVEWRIDSIGQGWTRLVSLCVGSTDQKSDRERKIH